MTRFTRLFLLARLEAWAYALLALGALTPLLALHAAPAPMDFERLSAHARTLAAQPYRPPESRTPEALRSLSYDQIRDIRFKPARALWRNEQLPFELMLFHLGKYQTAPVRLHEISPQGERTLPFNPADFDYGTNTLATTQWGDLGHAGLRVHYPLNTTAYKDELVVFQGASYFRALAAGTGYGLSARGLALDTVGAQREEFPRFTDLWVLKPSSQAQTLTVLALMDSPRLSAAYRFDIAPGATTSTTVQARIYLRGKGQLPLHTLGVAPLTSMFAFGENQPSRDDFRPEVHDSDGLMLATGEGEWLWRPLQNPHQPLVTSFATRSLRGFGLMQRDRSFASYEDAEARYERRPSAWVTPLDDWGPGRVELVQLPTPDESQDNIVAYWVPAKLPAPGQALNLRWRIDWQGDNQERPPTAWVSQTRVGRGFASLQPNEQQLLVDFTGPALPTTGAVGATVSTSASAQITEKTVYRIEATGAWRLVLRVKTLDSAQPVELRAHLTHDDRSVSETWTYILPPL